MSYFSRLVEGVLVHVVLLLLKIYKCSKISSLLEKIKLLVGEHNCQRPCGRPKVLTPNLVAAVASDLWPVLLLLQLSHVLPPTLCLQQYVVLHQVGWWDCTYFFQLGTIIPLFM